MRKRIILLMLDVAIILIATLLAVLLRDNFETRYSQLEALAPYFKATAFTAVPVLCMFGLDRAIWRMSSMRDYLFVSGASIAIVMLGLAEVFLINRLDGVSRSLPILQVVMMICGMVGLRVLARLRQAERNRARVQPSQALQDDNSIPYENILILGLGRIAELYIQSVDEFGAGTKRIVGLLGFAERHSGRRMHQYPILGPIGQIESLVRNLEVHGVFVDRIVLAFPFRNLPLSARQSILEIGKTSSIKIDFFAEQFESGHQATPAADRSHRSQSAPATVTEPKTPFLANSFFWALKRLIDVTGASIMIVALAPVFLVVAILVAFDIGLPLLFWQQRPGIGKQPFRVYKFRTMRGAYDWRGNRVNDELRSSAIGHLLRRTRLDELPQLFNIAIGQMSFVGPRPLLPIDQCASTPTRLLIRPGLTGWAQINGGRLLSIPEKMALDLWYVQNASLSVDLSIIARTITMILFGERRNDEAVRTARKWLLTQPVLQTEFEGMSVESSRPTNGAIPFDRHNRQVA